MLCSIFIRILALSSALAVAIPSLPAKRVRWADQLGQPEHPESRVSGQQAGRQQHISLNELLMDFKRQAESVAQLAKSQPTDRAEIIKAAKTEMETIMATIKSQTTLTGATSPAEISDADTEMDNILEWVKRLEQTVRARGLTVQRMDRQIRCIAILLQEKFWSARTPSQPHEAEGRIQKPSSLRNNMQKDSQTQPGRR